MQSTNPNAQLNPTISSLFQPLLRLQPVRMAGNIFWYWLQILIELGADMGHKKWCMLSDLTKTLCHDGHFEQTWTLISNFKTSPCPQNAEYRELGTHQPSRGWTDLSDAAEKTKTYMWTPHNHLIERLLGGDPSQVLWVRKNGLVEQWFWPQGISSGVLSLTVGTCKKKRHSNGFILKFLTFSEKLSLWGIPSKTWYGHSHDVTYMGAWRVLHPDWWKLWKRRWSRKSSHPHKELVDISCIYIYTNTDLISIQTHSVERTAIQRLFVF